MNFLVDTNVFSELAARKPNEQVVAWLRTHERELYLSTITIAEIRRGIETLPDGRRKAQLTRLPPPCRLGPTGLCTSVGLVGWPGVP